MIALAVGLVVVACDDDIYVDSQNSAEIKNENFIDDLLADKFELEHLIYKVSPNAFSPDGRKFVFSYAKYKNKISDLGTVDVDIPEKDYYISTNIPEKNLEYKGVAIYDLDQGKVTYNYRLPNTIFHIQEPSFNKTGTHIAFLADYEQFTTADKEYGVIFNKYTQYIWLHNELRPKQDLYVINIQKSEIHKHNISKHIEMPYIINAVPSPSGNKVALMPYIHWYKEWQAIQENSKLKKESLGGLETMIWEVDLLQQQVKPIVPQELIPEQWNYNQKNHFLYMSENSIRTMIFYNWYEKHYICDFDLQQLPLANTKKCMYESPIPGKVKNGSSDKFINKNDSYFSNDGKYIVTHDDPAFSLAYENFSGSDSNGFIISIENIAKYTPTNIPVNKVIQICPKLRSAGAYRCGYDIYGNPVSANNKSVFSDKYILTNTYQSLGDDITEDDIINKYGFLIYGVLGLYNIKTQITDYIRLGYSRNWVQTPHTVKDRYTISFPVIAEKWNLPYYENVKSKDDLYYVEWDKINKIWVKSTKQINE